MQDANNNINYMKKEAGYVGTFCTFCIIFFGKCESAPRK